MNYNKFIRDVEKGYFFTDKINIKLSKDIENKITIETFYCRVFYKGYLVYYKTPTFEVCQLYKSNKEIFPDEINDDGV